mmetsp:Transcript_21886/g.62779  ORF Transcript_21886/g.62779 Transcript_21886/m.62779 type:complete len:300 (+) Transcript_21886:57-956(+)
MHFWISYRSCILAVSLAGLLLSTSCAGTVDGAPATIILEPLVHNPDSAFVLTSTLRVVINSTDMNDDASIPIDLYSSDRIKFVLRPPPGVDEIRLSSSAPGEAIELIFRASLVEGPNVDKCQDSTSDADDGESALDQLLVGAFFKASVVGRGAVILSEAFAWERSYVSIEKYGCVVESRLYFQPTVEDGVILASIEKISWSAQYEVDLVGGIGDGSEALYKLELEDGTVSDALIQGGDVSMDITDASEENDGLEKEASDTPLDTTVSDESTTSGSSCKCHSLRLGASIFFTAFASLSLF